MVNPGKDLQQQRVWQMEYDLTFEQHNDQDLARKRADQILSLRLRLLEFEHLLDPETQDPVVPRWKEASK
jgi:hypothetical protein